MTQLVCEKLYEPGQRGRGRQVNIPKLMDTAKEAEAALDKQERDHIKQRHDLIAATFNGDNGSKAAAIIAAVSLISGVSKGEMIGRSKNHVLSKWRWTAYYLIRVKTSMSYEAIGTIFERDHSSILSGAGNAMKACRGKITMVEAILNGKMS